MRYTLRNLGPGNWFCVEAGRLLQPGDTVDVNRIDFGTKRLAEGEKRRLQILDHAGARLPPAPDNPASTSGATPAASKTPAPPPAPAATDPKSPSGRAKRDAAPPPSPPVVEVKGQEAPPAAPVAAPELKD